MCPSIPLTVSIAASYRAEEDHRKIGQETSTAIGLFVDLNVTLKWPNSPPVWVFNLVLRPTSSLCRSWIKKCLLTQESFLKHLFDKHVALNTIVVHTPQCDFFPTPTLACHKLKGLRRISASPLCALMPSSDCGVRFTVRAYRRSFGPSVAVSQLTVPPAPQSTSVRLTCWSLPTTGVPLHCHCIRRPDTWLSPAGKF